MHVPATSPIRPTDVAWLGEEGCDEIGVVGGKAAALSRLASRFSVPPGFCISSGYSSEHAPDPVLAAAVDSYNELGRRLGRPDPVVAVRSSAADEDGADSSFAGQHETVLGVAGESALVEAVRLCWASFGSARAAEYRRASGLDPMPAVGAVLVQELVLADAAGVGFSINPVGGCPDDIVLTANWGLGESVVSGTVTPDTFVVDKRSLEIRDRQIANKERMTVMAEEGAREVAVPRVLRDRPCLADEQVTAAAELVLGLEDAERTHVDVELAWRAADLFLLQCRPVTTVGRGASE